PIRIPHTPRNTAITANASGTSRRFTPTGRSQYWEDRSVEQTASELGLRPGTVRNRSMAALARLRELLGSERESLTTI
ncbi:hypothetical protein ABZY11_44485, partial [Streptomyces sp. NPDC006510]